MTDEYNWHDYDGSGVNLLSISKEHCYWSESDAGWIYLADDGYEYFLGAEFFNE